MIRIDVRQANKELKTAFSGLSGDQVSKAISRSINRTLAKGRTTIKANVKDRYKIDEYDFKQGFNIFNSNKNNLSGYVKASAKPISLTHFNPKFSFKTAKSSGIISVKKVKNAETGKYNFIKKEVRKRSNLSSALSVEVTKGQRKNIPFAFMIKGGSQKPVFARGAYSAKGGFITRNKRVNKAGSDLPISKLITVSVYSAASNKSVKEKNMLNMTEDYKKRLIHEINFITKKIK